MIRHYPAKVMNFASSARERSLSLKSAVDAMLEGEADAIIMDVASPEDIELWWHDDGFASSPFTKNAHHAGIVATAITLGQLQREKSDGLVAKSAQYFALASRKSSCAGRSSRKRSASLRSRFSMAACVKAVTSTRKGLPAPACAAARPTMADARKCVLPVPGGPQTAVTRCRQMASNASRWLGVKPRPSAP